MLHFLQWLNERNLQHFCIEFSKALHRCQSVKMLHNWFLLVLVQSVKVHEDGNSRYCICRWIVGFWIRCAEFGAQIFCCKSQAIALCIWPFAGQLSELQKHDMSYVISAYNDDSVTTSLTTYSIYVKLPVYMHNCFDAFNVVGFSYGWLFSRFIRHFRYWKSLGPDLSSRDFIKFINSIFFFKLILNCFSFP